MSEISAAVGATLRPLGIDPNGLGSVVCGMARGVDLAGEAWALRWGYPVERFPVTSEEWNRLGKRAGHLRNATMAQVATHAVLFRDDGPSPGTENMAAQLLGRGTPMQVFTRASLSELMTRRTVAP